MSRKRTWVWLVIGFVSCEAFFSLTGLINANWSDTIATLYGAAAGLTVHWIWNIEETP